MNIFKFIFLCIKNKSRLEYVLKIYHKGGRKCDICNKDFQLFSVNDGLYYKFFRKQDFICVDCFEKKIGRKLMKKDLKNEPVNEFLFKYIDE